jgi:hypothetical protein
MPLHLPTDRQLELPRPTAKQNVPIPFNTHVFRKLRRTSRERTLSPRTTMLYRLARHRRCSRVGVGGFRNHDLRLIRPGVTRWRNPFGQGGFIVAEAVAQNWGGALLTAILFT